MEDPLIGKTIHLYGQSKNLTSELEIKHFLGQSCSKVYLAKSRLNQSFALKIPSEPYRFHLESRFTYLSHPHIASPISSGRIWLQGTDQNENDIQIFHSLLMEYCPNGDFIKLVNSDRSAKLKDKVVRTYFHQLVSAVEYLHGKGIAHGDIKLDNLFLDKKFQLKLIDFDMAVTEDDDEISGGSPNYRAPEVRVGSYDIFKADIFSMAIVLFVLKNRNFLPFDESREELQAYFYQNPKGFWNLMEQSRVLQGLKGNIWSEDFKELFEGMTRADPKMRFSINDIKQNNWFRGETISKHELKRLMKGTR